MMSDHFLDFQSTIVQAFSDHHLGKEITRPPEDVAMENSHIRLSQEDIDNACAIALAFLGISDSLTPETSALRWLMRNYFLNPEFRATLPSTEEAAWSSPQS